MHVRPNSNRVRSWAHAVAFIGESACNSARGNRAVRRDNCAADFNPRMLYTRQLRQCRLDCTNAVLAAHSIDSEFGFHRVSRLPPRTSWCSVAAGATGQWFAAMRIGWYTGAMIDWRLLVTTFGTVFLAELGDKTQLATLAMASGARGSKAVVFIGAALALCATSALAVLSGEAISRVVSPALLRKLAGVAFVALGVLYLWPARD